MKKDLKELHKKFVEDARYSSKRSESTIASYKSCFDVFMKLMPATNLQLLTPETLTAFFKKLETRERKNGKLTKTGVKASTIETYFSKLGPFFSWLERYEYIKKNPLREMKRPIVNYDTIKYLKGEQIKKILNAINFSIKWPSNLIRKRNDLIIYLCFTCGLRKSEMRNISLNDINIEKRTITIRSETSKSKMERMVIINSDLLPRLTDYIHERNRRKIRTDYLIVSGNGDRKLSDAGLKHVIERIKEASGVNFHLHQLRHTYAINYLLNNNENIFSLQQLMGHRDVRMTAKYLRGLPTSELISSVEAITLDNLF